MNKTLKIVLIVIASLLILKGIVNIVIGSSYTDWEYKQYLKLVNKNIKPVSEDALKNVTIISGVASVLIGIIILILCYKF